MSDPLLERLEAARKLAREAGRHTLKYFQDPELAVEKKDDASPVTIADREAELLLRERIAEAFPHDAIVGEEFGSSAGTSGYGWILDPIDGTKSFISGVPLYGTLVGIERDGRGVAGVIEIPGLNERVFAARGHGAWQQRHDEPPREARVSDTARLEESLFVTSQVDTFKRRNAQQAFELLQSIAFLTRTWGDCYGYLLVATGRAELMLDPLLSIWDAAAVQPILEEAGGTFTDWQGNPSIHAGEGIGTNGKVLEEVLAITRGFPRDLSPAT